VFLVTVALAACSSPEPLAFELTIPGEFAGNPPNQPFVVTGALVDAGEVCPEGMFVYQRWENMDGTLVEVTQWATRFDAAAESGDVLEALGLLEFECADGTGTLKIEEHVHLDFGVLDPASLETERTNSGTFTVTGTNHYDALTGSGDVYVEAVSEQLLYVGEAKHG
jgi:hypothetical protein